MAIRMVVDGPCEFCAAWAAQKEIRDPVTNRLIGRRCDDCGQRIPRYLAMDGNGYRSQTEHHYHPSEGEGDIPIMRELCGPCYLADFAKKNPGATLPIMMPCIDIQPTPETPAPPEPEPILRPSAYAGVKTF